MICYTLPGMSEHADLLSLFIGLSQAYPDMFFDDVVIDSVYGGFPGCRLCGGRVNLGEESSLESVEQLIARYNERGVNCNATFTNKFVEIDELKEDAYSLGILQMLAKGAGNGVIVHSEDLAHFVRQSFPSLEIIASTTLSLGTPAAHKRALEHYDRVVLDYNLAHNEKAIACIPERDRLEIMVNEYCTLGCPWRDEHYAAVSRAQADGVECTFACRHEPAPQAYGFMQGLVDGNVFLHNSDIRHYCEQLGIGHFKIVGRGLDRYDVIDALIYYLVQPSCWYELRDFLVQHDYV